MKQSSTLIISVHITGNKEEVTIDHPDGSFRDILTSQVDVPPGVLPMYDVPQQVVDRIMQIAASAKLR